jgi:hypothetical protein
MYLFTTPQISILTHFASTRQWWWNRHSVPKRRLLNHIRRRTTQEVTHDRVGIISWCAFSIRQRLRHLCESGGRMVQAVKPNVVLKNVTGKAVWFAEEEIYKCSINTDQPSWPYGPRCGSATASLPKLWVRIQAGAWNSAYCGCCVLSCRIIWVQLIISPEESYRMWRV